MDNMEYNTSTGNDSIPFYNVQGRMPQPPMMIDRLLTFKQYAYPITTGFGVIGNSIIFYIFTKTKLKKPSTSRYLAASAIADIGYLVTTFLIRLDMYGIPLMSNIGPCQLLMFSNYVFLFLSTWYLVAVMVEKYIGVSWPRNKSRMCTVFRAKCVIISLAIMGLTCYLYITWFYGVMGSYCMVFLSDLGQAWAILSRIDAVVNFTIPYIIIFITTCLIWYQTWIYRRRSRTAGERFLRRTCVTNSEVKEFKTTPLLVLLATCTIIFCTPNNSSRLREAFQSTQTFRPTEMDLYITGIFHYLHMLNNAIKIAVYIAASNAFIREVGKQFCRIRHALQRTETNELLSRDGHPIEAKSKPNDIITEGVV